jgi:hypothetical protein
VRLDCVQKLTNAQLSRSRFELGEGGRVKGKRELLTAFSLFLFLVKRCCENQLYCEGLNASVDPPTDSEGVELYIDASGWGGLEDWGGLDEGGTLLWLFGACSDGELTSESNSCQIKAFNCPN